MKTTFDLPDQLVRRAKSAAAHQGRPLRDLVAEAIEIKLAADESAARATTQRDSAWKAFAARLKKMPDGTYYNPDGIEDESFFQSLEEIREQQMWKPRDPFADPGPTAAPATRQRGKPKTA